MPMLETPTGNHLPRYEVQDLDYSRIDDRPQVKHYRNRASFDKTYYVGKGSQFGNPYRLEGGEAGRAAAIKKYRTWLWKKLQDRDSVILAGLRRMTPETVLLCHCHPKDCHADVISKAWKWAKYVGKVLDV